MMPCMHECNLPCLAANTQQFKVNHRLFISLFFKQNAFIFKNKWFIALEKSPILIFVFVCLLYIFIHLLLYFLYFFKETLATPLKNSVHSKYSLLLLRLI